MDEACGAGGDPVGVAGAGTLRFSGAVNAEAPTGAVWDVVGSRVVVDVDVGFVVGSEAAVVVWLVLWDGNVAAEAECFSRE